MLKKTCFAYKQAYLINYIRYVVRIRENCLKKAFCVCFIFQSISISIVN